MTTENCNEFSCPSWATSEWSEVTLHLRLRTIIMIVKEIFVVEGYVIQKIFQFALSFSK